MTQTDRYQQVPGGDKHTGPVKHRGTSQPLKRPLEREGQSILGKTGGASPDSVRPPSDNSPQAQEARKLSTLLPASPTCGRGGRGPYALCPRNKPALLHGMAARI